MTLHFLFQLGRTGSCQSVVKETIKFRDYVSVETGWMAFYQLEEVLEWSEWTGFTQIGCERGSWSFIIIRNWTTVKLWPVVWRAMQSWWACLLLRVLIAVSQFRVCILLRSYLKANYIITPREVCPNLKAPLDAPSFPCFWRMHPYYPSYPFFAPKKSERERKWQYRVACITFVGLGSRNCDIRVKHLVMQPGNAPKARPSHLTTADKVNKVSEGLAFKDSLDLHTSDCVKADSGLVCLSLLTPCSYSEIRGQNEEKWETTCMNMIGWVSESQKNRNRVSVEPASLPLCLYPCVRWVQLFLPLMNPFQMFPLSPADLRVRLLQQDYPWCTGSWLGVSSLCRDIWK